MEQSNENGFAFMSGIAGTVIMKIILGVPLNWQNVEDAILDLLWVGAVAAFSGAMGVLGKHYVGKLIKRFSKNKKP